MARFVGNTGQSMEDAVVILDARTTAEGIAAEYKHLEALFGKRNIDWRLHRQTLAKANGRHYDVMTVEISPTDFRDVYFDITDFFGK